MGKQEDVRRIGGAVASLVRAARESRLDPAQPPPPTLMRYQIDAAGVAERIRRLGFAGPLADASLADFSGVPTGLTMAGWCTRPSGCLLLYGEPGVGKTHSALACYRACWLAGWYTVFIDCCELARMIQPAWEDWDECVLILDDIGGGLLAGKGYAADDARADLLLAINRRVKRNLPMLVTSNLSPKRLSAEIDARLASRLCSGIVIRCVGADRRVRGATTIKEKRDEHAERDSCGTGSGGDAGRL